MFKLEIEGHSFDIEGMLASLLMAKLEAPEPVIFTQANGLQVILGNTQGRFYCLRAVEDSAPIG